MLTTSTRPATPDEIAEANTEHLELPDRSRGGCVLSLVLTLAGLLVIGIGVAALVFVIPSNAAGRIGLPITAVLALAMGGLCWREAWRTTFGTKRRQRPPAPDLTLKLVEQWRCTALRYYFWDVTGDMPCLLALTQRGDLLLVQTQAIYGYIDFESASPPTLGEVCCMETMDETPLTILFEGAQVPVEVVDAEHSFAGLLDLDMLLIRVPRRTFEQLSQLRRG